MAALPSDSSASADHGPGAVGQSSEWPPSPAAGPSIVAAPVVVAVDERHGRSGGPRPRIDVSRWAALAEAVLRDERVAGGELGLLFVDPAPMAGLNREHMDSDGPTDVLAFPLDGGAAAGGAGGAPSLIGDVVVCPARAAEQAPDHRGPGHDGTLEDELALLVVHGVLHALGYDHASQPEAAAMRAREEHLLTAHHRVP